MYNPFPEEMNRVVAGKFTKWHFAPTEVSKGNLLAEGVPEENITVTGNTVIDALLYTAKTAVLSGIELPEDKRLVLFTAHRRENFGEPFENICQAVRDLVDEHEDIVLLYPIHPNPNIRATAMKYLGGHERIQICDPLNYQNFVAAMKRSTLILSDSGGVQEEAPALGVPVLVLRTTTERPEAVSAGAAKLVGTDRDVIYSTACEILNDPAARQKMIVGGSPYGDGTAAQQIVATLLA